MQVLEVGVPRVLDLLLVAAVVVVVVVEERAPHQPTAPIKVRVLGAGMPKILHHRLGAVVYHRWMTLYQSEAPGLYLRVATVMY